LTGRAKSSAGQGLRADRRCFLAATFGACGLASVEAAGIQTAAPGSGALKEARDRMTPRQVLDELKKGNERFRTAQLLRRDFRDQQRTSAAGQFPAAVGPFLPISKRSRAIQIVGGMYDLTTGAAELLSGG